MNGCGKEYLMLYFRMKRMEKSRELLKRFWGYDAFRPLQEEIVDASINGYDVIAVLPTGGGKSVCFQVPGIAREGVVIVISPLIALMQDQVAQLQSRGIRAALLSADLSYYQVDKLLDNARFGGLDFLYISPERIQSSLFQERFKRMQPALLVVDEAHCISEWGHDFRPAYLHISRLRDWHPSAPIMALTATATKRVIDDIQRHLGLQNPLLFQGSLERKNISYRMVKSAQKEEHILTYCQNKKDVTGIIYCQTRRSVKRLYTYLKNHGLSVGLYHAGMSHEDRKLYLEWWMTGRLHIMIATNAFGMGIDKGDVRFVIHYEMPNNMEAYMQESGRAGRDEEASEAIGMYTDEDLSLMDLRIEEQFPEIETVRRVFGLLCNDLRIAYGSGLNETYPIDYTAFSLRQQIDPAIVYHSLRLLEMSNIVTMHEGVFRPTIVQFVTDHSVLYNFQVSHSQYLPLTRLLLRSYPGIFENHMRINEQEIAKRLNVPMKALRSQLEDLLRFGIIDATFSSDKPMITLQTVRPVHDDIMLLPEKYSQRKAFAETRLSALKRFIQAESCRMTVVYDYFDTKGQACGKCDCCLLLEPSDENISHRLKDFLKKPRTSEEIFNQFEYAREEIRILLRKLLLSEELVKNGDFWKCR
jgi:ATP-dependent DNA helicase RecQ